MKKYIVPVDFSDHAEYALKAAAQLAVEDHSEILALHMLELSDSYFSASDAEHLQELYFYLKIAEDRFNEFLDKPYLKNISVIPLVALFQKKTFLSIVAHNADFSFSLLTRFAEDLIDADNSIVSLGQKSVSERMATILLYLRKYIGINADGSLAVQLSRSDYANIIGAATESVIRVLADFKQDGLISMHNKRIIINNTGALRARSSSVNQ